MKGTRQKLTPAEKAEKAKQRLERAKKAIATSQEAMRKYETRQKIVIGATLMKAAAKYPHYARTMQELVRLTEERDRQMFEAFLYATEKP